MGLRLLAVGDMHLGRRPSRLPETLSERAQELGPAEAWRRVVDAAIREQVHAVALAGDVVEREDDLYEGFRQLHDGVQRLQAAGIEVLGIAGNHDVQVLPRLADRLPGFRLLGRGGQWQSASLSAAGERLTLWGWSFPRARVTQSPLDAVTLTRQPGPNLGLLHCDRNQPGSPYAPVTGRELEAAGLDGWLLGHIHAPDPLASPHPTGYLGSVTGMDPGEPGAHGPWLVTVEDGRIRSVSQWVLAPLRWEALEVALTGISEAEQARLLLLDAVRALDAELAGAMRPPQAVGLRVTLAGRTSFGEAALALFGEEARAHLFAGEAGTHFFIERLIGATGPEISLESLARRSDPPGLLARRLQLLERPAADAERRAMISETRRRMEARLRDARWQGLNEAPPDDEAVAEWLRRAGSRLLEQMLAQTQAAP